MPRTLIDLIDETAPKARSQYIISLIDSFFQHPVEHPDLTELSHPDDEVISFTLRVSEETREKLRTLCNLRMRDRNPMIQVLVYSQIMQGY